MDNLLPTVFISSFVMIWAIVSLTKSKQWFANETDLEGIQKFHIEPVARIGGLGIFVGFSVALFLLEDQSGLLFKIWLSSLPVFVVGLYEDLSARISPGDGFAFIGLRAAAVFSFACHGINAKMNY
jgi:UDP-GlcNAc:undecaprenyl-phosphate/decaprenyl-phosphate GlcNAc-1-phosphate transferase